MCLNVPISVVHSSIHTNCHHQIVFAKFDLKIYYPSLYEREVWHCQEADAILIRQAIYEFSWKRDVSNLTVDEQVTVFNRTILNILIKFIPHETIAWDSKDLPWINKRVKSLIQEGTLLFEIFRKNRNNVTKITCLSNLNDRLALLINTALSKIITLNIDVILRRLTTPLLLFSFTLFLFIKFIA